MYKKNILNDSNTHTTLKFTKISLKFLKNLPNKQPIGYPIDYAINPITRSVVMLHLTLSQSQQSLSLLAESQDVK